VSHALTDSVLRGVEAQMVLILAAYFDLRTTESRVLGILVGGLILRKEVYGLRFILD